MVPALISRALRVALRQSAETLQRADALQANAPLALRSDAAVCLFGSAPARLLFVSFLFCSFIVLPFPTVFWRVTEPHELPCLLPAS